MFSKRAVRGIALAFLAAIVAAVAVTSASGIAGADTYPGLSDIAAAQAAVADAQTGVAELDAAIVNLETAAQDAQREALGAGDRYVGAKDTADRAKIESVAATQSAADAAVQLEQARTDLAAVALQVYRDGGKMTSLEALVGANGFEDVIARTEDNDRAASQMDAVTQKVKAAELYASTMSDFAKQSAEVAATAADDAAQALAAAEDSQRSADQAVADAESTRGAALERLASLQNTTVALETARQQGLADARTARERAAFEVAVQAAQAQAAAPAPSAGGTTSGSTGTTGGTTSGSTGTTGGTTSGSTGTTPVSDPVVTTPSSGWASSASQGQAAATYAQTLMGTPYLLGGNGPAYDCSGVTYAAWSSVGYTLSRSSQWQYNSTTHVPISEMRPGDLVFYGTNRSTSSIYHVAIYIGSGLVAEATKPGDVAQVRAYDASWRINSLIPYVGRP